MSSSDIPSFPAISRISTSTSLFFIATAPMAFLVISRDRWKRSTASSSPFSLIWSTSPRRLAST